MSCESYDLRLTTLSPIHIGSGKSYSCCEFVPAKAKSKGQIVKIIKRVNLTNYYSSLSDDRKDTFLASLTNSNFELKQFDKKIKKDFVRYQCIDNSYVDSFENVQEHIKTSDKLYIPGSSIKGAIRTAIFYDLLTEEDMDKIGKGYNDYLYDNLLRKHFSSGFGNDAQNNIFRFMQVTDTTTTNIPKIEQVLVVMATNKGRKKYYYSKHGKTYLETIGANKKFKSRLTTTFDSNIYRKLKLEDKSEILDLNYLKDVLFKFSRDLIYYEMDFADKYDIDYLSKFYENLNKKNTVDAPLLKIGAGSGLMATSIAMKLKEYNPLSFERVRKSFSGRNYEFEFPKSRKVTKQKKPFGWVKLEFN
nr:type III-A CRISPR-associated RAMP protein Csm5 [Methanobrevibacter smithii]